MKTVYVAGPYSADNVLKVFDNMRNGMEASLKVLKMGFAPFVPWFDYHFTLMDKKMTVKLYYAYSMAWLEKADAVVVLKGWEGSKGTLAEIRRAEELGIPVYYGIPSLKKFKAHFKK